MMAISNGPSSLSCMAKSTRALAAKLDQLSLLYNKNPRLSITRTPFFSVFSRKGQAKKPLCCANGRTLANTCLQLSQKTLAIAAERDYNNSHNNSARQQPGGTSYGKTEKEDKRLRIIIIGGGSVGAAICAQLATEHHDITVIDTDMAALSEIANVCDVFGVVGNGAEVAVQRKAGAERADLLVAVTSNDEMNILCCAVAKKLGTAHTIARVRNPEYAELMQLMRSEMGLSLTINPELATAREIYRMLRFPAAAKIEPLCHGRVEMAEFVVAPDSPLSGVSLNDLRSRLQIKFLVCSVLRAGQAYIPSGDFVIREGDVVCVTTPDDAITRFFKAIGGYRQPVRDVLIAGGGRTTYYLEEMLGRGGIRSTVIEKDRAKCEELAEAFDCNVICDSGIKQERLLEEGIEHTDAFLSLSSVDEENAIMSMYAKTKNLQKIVTMIGTMSYVDLFKGVGLESIVSPKASTATYILRYVRSISNLRDSSEIQSLHKIMDGQVEALEFAVKEEIAGLTDIPLMKLSLRKNVLIACIARGGEVLIPTGSDCIRAGDTVVIMTLGGQMKSIKDVIL